MNSLCHIFDTRVCLPFKSYMRWSKKIDLKLFFCYRHHSGLRLVRKKSLYGAPVEVNYTAMIYSLIVRIIEGIPTIKDLIKRLQHDILFRLDCGFMLSESIPSQASYSRLVRKISQSNALEEIQKKFRTSVGGRFYP